MACIHSKESFLAPSIRGGLSLRVAVRNFSNRPLRSSQPVFKYESPQVSQKKALSITFTWYRRPQYSFSAHRHAARTTRKRARISSRFLAFISLQHSATQHCLQQCMAYDNETPKHIQSDVSWSLLAGMEYTGLPLFYRTIELHLVYLVKFIPDFKNRWPVIERNKVSYSVPCSFAHADTSTSMEKPSLGPGIRCTPIFYVWFPANS